MRFAALSAVVLCLLVGYSQAATIREGREGEPVEVDSAAVVAVIEDQKPIEASPVLEVVSELRREAEPSVAEAIEAIVEQKVAEAVVAEQAAEQVEELVPLQQLRIVEPVIAVQDPVAIVLAETELVSEIKAEPIVSIVEPEVAVRSTEIEPEIVSELKAVPVQAVEEIAIPAAAVFTEEEPIKTETVEAAVEEVAPVIALKSIPLDVEEEKVPAVQAVEPVVAEAAAAAPAAPIAPVEAPIEAAPETNNEFAKKLITEEVKPEEEKQQEEKQEEENIVKKLEVQEVEEVKIESAAVEAEISPEVQPVEGTMRQNSGEVEASRPTFLQQAQQVLTNNPITQFIANNPIANAIRGGTTSAPGTAEEAVPAAPTTARPGLFAQLFNPSTAAPVANAAPEAPASTAAPGFIQAALTNIQSALPQNIQNIFNRNASTTAAPATPAAAPAAPATIAAIADSPSSNAIDQAKKKRIDETEEEMLMTTQ